MWNELILLLTTSVIALIMLLLFSGWIILLGVLKGAISTTDLRRVWLWLEEKRNG